MVAGNKKDKKKVLRESGWAVWNVKTGEMLTSAYSSRDAAWNAYTYSVYFPFYRRHRMIRCLMSSIRGKL